MKSSRVLMLLFFVGNVFLSFSQVERYSGTYKWDYRNIFYVGDVNYSYSIGEGNVRQFEGHFSFTGQIDYIEDAASNRGRYTYGWQYDESFLYSYAEVIAISGNYLKGKKVGEWITQFRGGISKSSYIKKNYVNGNLDGPFEINLSTNERTYHAVGSFKNNKLLGEVKCYIEINTSKGIYRDELSVNFDENAFFHGVFTFRFRDYNGIWYSDRREFNHGQLQEILIKNESNGTILYSHKGSILSFSSFEKISQNFPESRSFSKHLRSEYQSLGLTESFRSDYGNNSPIPDDIAQYSENYMNLYNQIKKEDPSVVGPLKYYYYPMRCHPFNGPLTNINLPQAYKMDNRWKLSENDGTSLEKLTCSLLPNYTYYSEFPDQEENGFSFDKIASEYSEKIGQMIVPINDIEQVNIGAANFFMQPIKLPLVYNKDLRKLQEKAEKIKREQDSISFVIEAKKLINTFKEETASYIAATRTVEPKVQVFALAIDQFQQKKLFKELDGLSQTDQNRKIEELKKDPGYLTYFVPIINDSELRKLRDLQSKIETEKRTIINRLTTKMNYQWNTLLLDGKQLNINTQSLLDEKERWIDSSILANENWSVEFKNQLNGYIRTVEMTQNEYRSFYMKLSSENPKYVESFNEIQKQLFQKPKLQALLYGTCTLSEAVDNLLLFKQMYILFGQNFEAIKWNKLESWNDLITALSEQDVNLEFLKKFDE